jgi:cytochrome bd ubiquinol oxidase subunit II
MGIDLPVLWAIIIGVGLMMYIVMDGFDLGIGILFPFVRDRQQRDLMVNSVAPVWDGNETWLVLGGAALYAAFPLAYGLILSALYLPIMLMLAGLILRGVSFEFRFKAEDRFKPLWDRAFSFGSFLAAFCQGVALGAWVNGFPTQDYNFTGGALDCFTPFSLLTGVGAIVSYSLLGSTWLVMKTEDALKRQMRRLAQWIAILLFFVIFAVSLWAPLAHDEILDRWLVMPNLFYFAPVPLLVLITTWLQLRVLQNRDIEAAPFALALFMIFLGYTGLAISMWPNIIPPRISIWDAASSPESMGFTLVGTLFIIPIIMAYTSWSYYVFRGKSSSEEGY